MSYATGSAKNTNQKFEINELTDKNYCVIMFTLLNMKGKPTNASNYKNFRFTEETSTYSRTK